MFTVTVAVPLDNVAVAVVEPPSKVYVTTWLPVPVSVNTAFAPEQTEADAAATVADRAAGAVIVTVLELKVHRLASDTFTE